MVECLDTEPAMLAQAFDWMSEDMNFAYALHLAKAGDHDVLLSVDGKLAKVAKGRAPIPVEAP